MESVGVWARIVGAIDNQPTVGYSTHVRIATLGRFFILLSAPTLGYLVDQGAKGSDISLVGGISFLIIFFMILLFYKVGYSYFGKVYAFFNKGPEPQVPDKVLLTGKTLDRKFLLMSILSFVFTASGLIVVNILASINPDMRAMIVQLSALITALGTLIHIFYIDPKLSHSADNDTNQLIVYVQLFLIARLSMSVVIFLIFLFLSTIIE